MWRQWCSELLWFTERTTWGVPPHLPDAFQLFPCREKERFSHLGQDWTPPSAWVNSLKQKTVRALLEEFLENQLSVAALWLRQGCWGSLEATLLYQKANNTGTHVYVCSYFPSWVKSADFNFSVSSTVKQWRMAPSSPLRCKSSENNGAKLNAVCFLKGNTHLFGAGDWMNAGVWTH